MYTHMFVFIYKYWSICSNALTRMVCTVSSSSGWDSAQSTGNHGRGKGRASCSSNHCHRRRCSDLTRLTHLTRCNAFYPSKPMACFFSASCSRRRAFKSCRYSLYVPSWIILSLQAFCNIKFLRLTSFRCSSGLVW